MFTHEDKENKISQLVTKLTGSLKMSAANAQDNSATEPQIADAADCVGEDGVCRVSWKPQRPAA